MKKSLLKFSILLLVPSLAACFGYITAPCNQGLAAFWIGGAVFTTLLLFITDKQPNKD